MSTLAKRTSVIWKHFTPITKGRAKCEHCAKIISFTGGGTGNLNRHMKKIHVNIQIYPKIRIQKNTKQAVKKALHPQLDVPAAPCTSYLNELNIVGENSYESASTSTENLMRPTSSVQKPLQTMIVNYAKTTELSPGKIKQLNEQIVKFVVKGFHAFSIVEEPEFKNMYHLILPAYELPTQKTITENLIPTFYRLTKKKVLLQLTSADTICLTTDGWTSVNNVSYFSLTAHFINESTELKSVLLGCHQFDGQKTSDNLASFLKEEVEEWGITNKIIGVITDNEPDVVAAIQLTNWHHLICFAHDINLVVSHSLDVIKEQLEKVKAIVHYFRQSSYANHKLREIQVEMQLPLLKLKQSIISRWNSTYDMLARFLKIKDAVVTTLSLEQPKLNTLSLDEWQTLEESVKILKGFYEITEEISSEKTVSISKLIVFVRIVKRHLSRCLQECSSESCKKLIEDLQTRLNNRFRDVEDDVLASEASFLDPRFKRHAFSNKENYEQCLRSIKKRLCSLTNQNTQAVDDQQVQSDDSSSMWAEFDKELQKEIAINPTAASIVELGKYLNEPLLKRSDDPLLWWDDRRLLYPNLYKLMKRRLCVTATSVPSERIFTKAGITLSARRSSLNSSNATKVIFLNHNLE